MTPTKGRILYYTPSIESVDYISSPLVAIVTDVVSKEPPRVTVTVFAPGGLSTKCGVLLVPREAQTPAEGNFCQWPEATAQSIPTPTQLAELSAQFLASVQEASKETDKKIGELHLRILELERVADLDRRAAPPDSSVEAA